MQSMWWRKLNFKNIFKSILKTLLFLLKISLILFVSIVVLIIFLLLFVMLITEVDYNFSNDVKKCTSYQICKEGLMIKTHFGTFQVSKDNCKGEEVIRWDDKKKSCFYDEYVIMDSWKKD